MLVSDPDGGGWVSGCEVMVTNWGDTLTDKISDIQSIKE